MSNDNDEIVEVERWGHHFVSYDTGMPYVGALTGTPTQPFPRVIQRYIQTFPKRKVHKGCGGEVVHKTDTRWKDSTSFLKQWDECETCHKTFNETGYE